MKLTMLLIVSCLAVGLCHAQERLTYAEAVALVKERGANVTKDTIDGVYVLGPQSSVEITEVQGKETKRHVPYCRMCSTGSIGQIIGGSVFKGNTSYTVEVVRPGSEKPIVKIIGQQPELLKSQYPLKPGDVVFIIEQKSK